MALKLNNDKAKELANDVIARRKESGLSFLAFSRAYSINKTTLRYTESAEGVYSLQTKTIRRLCTVLNIDQDTFLTKYGGAHVQ